MNIYSYPSDIIDKIEYFLYSNIQKELDDIESAILKIHDINYKILSFFVYSHYEFSEMYIKEDPIYLRLFSSYFYTPMNIVFNKIIHDLESYDRSMQNISKRQHTRRINCIKEKICRMFDFSPITNQIIDISRHFPKTSVYKHLTLNYIHPYYDSVGTHVHRAFHRSTLPYTIGIYGNQMSHNITVTINPFTLYDIDIISEEFLLSLKRIIQLASFKRDCLIWKLLYDDNRINYDMFLRKGIFIYFDSNKYKAKNGICNLFDLIHFRIERNINPSHTTYLNKRKCAMLGDHDYFWHIKHIMI